jgi:uncharacterized protein YcfJ
MGRNRHPEKAMKAHLILLGGLATAVGVTALSPIHAQDRDDRRVVCEDVQVRHSDSSDNHQVAGTAIGAVAGGVVGNQIGSGKGRTLATVAGAVGGGVIGHNVQKNNQEKNATTTTERRCHPVD